MNDKEPESNSEITIFITKARSIFGFIGAAVATVAGIASMAGFTLPIIGAGSIASGLILVTAGLFVGLISDSQWNVASSASDVKEYNKARDAAIREATINNTKPILPDYPTSKASSFDTTITKISAGLDVLTGNLFGIASWSAASTASEAREYDEHQKRYNNMSHNREKDYSFNIDRNGAKKFTSMIENEKQYSQNHQLT